MATSQSSTNSDVNVLLLGETGVGKSTFINAFANYIYYETLKDALKEDLLWLVPASFTVTDFDTFEQKAVQIGDDPNETFKTGQSSTQSCRIYTFPIDEERVLRIIDTPGVGDTRGVNEDAKNFENIMSCLSNYRHLNAICLLLKPNESRLTIFFRFCIKELLTHLHRSAVNNIIFCFTNARSTFYSPGETAPLLRDLLADLKKDTGIDVSFTKKNTFCFDNEAFRFVVARKQNIKFDDKIIGEYERSWNTSVEQTLALIERINQCTPHRVRETVSLNEARRLIYELSRPIAEITRNIQININVINEKMNELSNTKDSIANLSKKLRIPVVDLECQSLPYPRTVCTANKCTQHVQVGAQVKIDYKTHCHEHCYLQGVAQNVVNNSALQKCQAMNTEGKCQHCGCFWNCHMHITYETEQVFTEIIDKSIEAQLKTKEGAAAAIQRHKRDLENRIRNLKNEQRTLTSVCVKLSKFLHKNSITPYNDDLIKYVEYLVREEKEKRQANANNEQIIHELENMINTYQEEINTYKKMLNSSQAKQLNDTLQIEDIYELVDSLYNLPFSGASLRKQIQLTRQSVDAVAIRFETVCRSPSNKRLLSRLNVVYKKIIN